MATEKIAVRCKTKEDFNRITASRPGFKWNGADEVWNALSDFNRRERRGCVSVLNKASLSYCHYEWYKREGYKIITVEEYFNNKPSEQTKEKEDMISYKYPTQVHVIDKTAEKIIFSDIIVADIETNIREKILFDNIDKFKGMKLENLHVVMWRFTSWSVKTD